MRLDEIRRGAVKSEKETESTGLLQVNAPELGFPPAPDKPRSSR